MIYWDLLQKEFGTANKNLFHYMYSRNLFNVAVNRYTVKPVLVATSIKQATCIKQACIEFPKQANTLRCTCIKQAPVLSKQILIVP